MPLAWSDFVFPYLHSFLGEDMFYKIHVAPTIHSKQMKKLCSTCKSRNCYFSGFPTPKARFILSKPAPENTVHHTSTFRMDETEIKIFVGFIRNLNVEDLFF